MRHHSKNDYLYIGCFLDLNTTNELLVSLENKRLRNTIKSPHVTLAFLPDSVKEDCFGSQVVWNVTGYGNDGKNEGVRVEPAYVPEELLDVVTKRRCHHITISLADGARAKDTASLVFDSIIPYAIVTTYGACTVRGDVVVQRAK